jgi:hypothetical protein
MFSIAILNQSYPSRKSTERGQPTAPAPLAGWRNFQFKQGARTSKPYLFCFQECKETNTKTINTRPNNFELSILHGRQAREEAAAGGEAAQVRVCPLFERSSAACVRRRYNPHLVALP